MERDIFKEHRHHTLTHMHTHMHTQGTTQLNIHLYLKGRIGIALAISHGWICIYTHCTHFTLASKIHPLLHLNFWYSHWPLNKQATPSSRFELCDWWMLGKASSALFLIQCISVGYSGSHAPLLSELTCDWWIL